MDIRLNQPYSFTQLGRRANQEDSRYPDCDTPKDPQPFFVVCDGVGGNEKGEVASRTVCDAFGKALAGRDWSCPFTVRDFEQALDFAFNELQRVSTLENKGMATTLTFVAFHSNGCFIAHIGDSRVYYVRPGSGIVYRTDDHSLVNALVRAGVITEKEAETHPDRNVITRSVCVPDAEQERSAATTVNITDVRPGDYVFMCSDGVLKNLSDDMLVEILGKPASDAEKCARIAAMSVDSDDNNTAYLVSVDSVAGALPVEPQTATRIVTPAEARPAGGYTKRKKTPMGAVIAAAVVLAILIVAAVVVFSGLKGGEDKENVEKASEEKTEMPSEKQGMATAPSFKGDMQKFINDNLRYPADATKEGTVEVRFKIEEDGTTDDVEVVKGVDPAIDKEAVRLCRMMRFEPARNADGTPEEVAYNQKITFRRPAAKQPAVQPKKQGHDGSVKPQTQTQEQEQVSPEEALKRKEEQRKKREAEAERQKIEKLAGQPLQSI